MTSGAAQATFMCPCCVAEKPMSRASKRFREGRRPRPDRCLDCESAAAKARRRLLGDAINARRRIAAPKHREKQKDTMLRKSYGISLAEWRAAFSAQGECCAICESKAPGGRGWQTDHNHETGRFRAILCHGCNSVLGHAKESPHTLLAAFRYLCHHGGGADQFLSQHFKRQLTDARAEA